MAVAREPPKWRILRLLLAAVEILGGALIFRWLFTDGFHDDSSMGSVQAVWGLFAALALFIPGCVLLIPSRDRWAAQLLPALLVMAVVVLLILGRFARS